MSATVVLVHGSWAGAWCFEPVIEQLERRGLPTLAVDRPGHGESSEPIGDLHDDAGALRAVLDGLNGPIVLLGHSSGGMVITEAAAGQPSVRHLVYLCAFMPADNESVISLAQSVGVLGPEPALILGDDGTIRIDPGAAINLFFSDCEAADAKRAARRLGPDSAVFATQTPSGIAWREKPSTYVVCTEDRAFAVPLQRRLATRASQTIEWPTGHSPFLSRPELVADLLDGLARHEAVPRRSTRDRQDGQSGSNPPSEG